MQSISGAFYDNTSQAVSTLTTAPAPSAGSGTITTTGVYFTTSVANDLKVGDWVFSSTHSQVRMVTYIDDTGKKGMLNAAFAADLAAVALSKIPNLTMQGIWAIIVQVTGTTSIINGLTYNQNSVVPFGIPTNAEIGAQRVVKPVVIDGTSSKTCNVIIHHFSR